MRTAIVRSVLAALVAPLPAQDNAGKVPVAPRVAWHAPGIPNVWQTPPILDGLIYLGGPALVALDVETGQEKLRSAEPGKWWHPVHGGSVIFARHYEGRVHAFTPDLDRSIWSMPIDRAGYYPGVARGDIFMIASGNELLAITGGDVLWRVDLGERINMTPAVDETKVYVGSANGNVVAVTIATGKEAWRFETEAHFGTSNPVVDGDMLFLADRGIEGARKAALNAFDSRTGDLRWSTQFGSTGFGTPHPDHDTVWGGFGVRVAQFDRTTGVLDRAGSIKTGRNPFGRPGVLGDVVIFGNLDGHLYVHDRKTRALRWRFSPNPQAGGKAQVGNWWVHDGLLIVGTGAGVFALAETEGKGPVAPDFVLRPKQ